MVAGQPAEGAENAQAPSNCPRLGLPVFTSSRVANRALRARRPSATLRAHLLAMAETKTSPFRKLPPLTATGITYRLYESPTTGLRGMLMETAEPLCSLHVAIATESDTHDWTHKDDGLPHTLEHAIFMGSELYPFKGILDKLANRCLARGTNAWTATDHTCYTMTSAGHEGCLNLCALAKFECPGRIDGESHPQQKSTGLGGYMQRLYSQQRQESHGWPTQLSDAF